MGKPVLRLFVTGQTDRSVAAIANANALMADGLGDDYELTIIDIVKDPAAAEKYRVLATPLLLRDSPRPVRRFVGVLADHGRLLRALQAR